MRLHHMPPALLQLLATFLFHTHTANATPNPNALLGKLAFNDLFGRDDCGIGNICGYYSQLCCTSGSACYTGLDSKASCTAGGAATAGSDGGSWVYYTTTYVETDLLTTTKVISSYIPGASSAATAVPTMVCAANNPACGSICCASDQYCFNAGTSQCTAAAGGASGSASGTYAASTAGNPTAIPPLLGTSSSQTTVVATVSPTTTVPFISPVATGSNVTVTPQEDGSGGGLSGGAIAGIVIGTLAGLALLALLIFCCCVRGLIDGCFAIFGIGGRKKRRTTEIEEYEHVSHHASGAGGGGGRRTWYGAARPARVEKKEKSHEGRNLLGVGLGLAALWAFLGLKRRREQRHHEEKYSDESSYGYTDDYTVTSESSMTRDDHHTHTPSRYSRR